jgi:hypothetical protein
MNGGFFAGYGSWLTDAGYYAGIRRVKKLEKSGLDLVFWVRKSGRRLIICYVRS